MGSFYHWFNVEPLSQRTMTFWEKSEALRNSNMTLEIDDRFFDNPQTFDVLMNAL